MEDLILIIDFMNYFHRGRVGNLEGKYVLVFNFFKNLRATIADFKPSKLFFALEGHPKHRYDLYPNYKANRIVKTADKQTVKDQLMEDANLIKELLLYLPTTLVKHPNFEADDVVNTLCLNMKDDNVVIYSSDSDYIQILQQGHKNCKLYNAYKKDYVQPPDYSYLIFKCLTGDKSDNIPSLLKPKKCQAAINDPALFKQFLDVEENRANFNINKELIEFKTIPIDELVVEEGASNFDKLKEEFVKMEFHSIVNDVSWERFCNTFDCIKY